MSERPILFSAPMVRAILAGTKTQTRRVVKMRKCPDFGCEMAPGEIAGDEHRERLCPYGQPGHKLWVREAWAWSGDVAVPECQRVHDGEVWFRADPERNSPAIRWRPSIHMPRWASRITLEVTGVRVERLQDISEADAIAEGIERSGECNWRDYGDPHNDFTSARRSYRSLWELINGAGAWDANPWVWCVAFRAVKP